MTTTMADRPDIWHAAALSLSQHGEHAPEFAEGRISELTIKGDVGGVVLWGEILAAIASLRSRPGRLKLRRSRSKPTPRVKRAPVVLPPDSPC